MTRGAIRALLFFFLVACGSKTGLPEGDGATAGATPVPTGDLPGDDDGDGFVCPASPPKGGTPCGAVGHRYHHCGRYEVDRCPILAACVDGVWHTVDCDKSREP
jgi:hypothetical protein